MKPFGNHNFSYSETDFVSWFAKRMLESKKRSAKFFNTIITLQTTHQEETHFQEATWLSEKTPSRDCDLYKIRDHDHPTEKCRRAVHIKCILNCKKTLCSNIRP